MSQALVVSTHP